MKSRTKNLGLAGVFLGVSIATLPSCTPYQLASLYEQSRAASANHRQADAMDRNSLNVANSGIDYRNLYGVELFTCTGRKDKNEDGVIDLETEIWNKGKTDFFVGEKIIYGIVIKNGQGRRLEFFRQDSPGAVPTRSNEGGIIPEYLTSYFTAPVELKAPAVWNSYWAVDGVKMGENMITVRERPNNQQSLDNVGSFIKK